MVVPQYLERQTSGQSCWEAGVGLLVFCRFHLFFTNPRGPIEAVPLLTLLITSLQIPVLFLKTSTPFYPPSPQGVSPVFIALFPPPPAMDLTLWQYQFRIIMLGDSTVGKSSLLKRYTEDLFLESINQTVGVDFYVHFLEVEQGVRVKLQFWDTAGQERFR